MQVDTQKLTAVVTACFQASMDGRFSTLQQATFNSLGRHLRMDLLGLLSAQFNDGTAAVDTANQQLAIVSQQVVTMTNNLAIAGQVVQNITTLTGVLDGLLSIAAKIA